MFQFLIKCLHMIFRNYRGKVKNENEMNKKDWMKSTTVREYISMNSWIWSGMEENKTNKLSSSNIH